jgi:hypothetical protein
LFKHTGDCKIENNILNHLRHSLSFQCGANGNVAGYNYSTDPNRSEFPANFGADISLHGHYPYANLFEGNIVQNIMIDQTWGPSGPFNTFFRNRAELYGVVMTSGTVQSDSLNFAGNEIPNTGPFMGNYILYGAGHFEYGNNVQGTITPAGTTTLNDSSYYLSSVPSFWNTSSPFPSIGEPAVPGSGSIPAKDRFASGIYLAVCGTDSIVTGISTSEPVDEITVYPNPASTLLNISVRNAQHEYMSLALTDVLGMKLAEKKILAQEKIIQLELPVNCKPGVYLLMLRSDQSIVTKKVLVR